MVSNEEIKRRLDRKRRGLDEIQVDEKSIKYKTCPYCRFKNPENSIFCVKCGKKLEKTVNIKCNACGTSNPKTAKFCVKCGNNLTSNESNSENHDQNMGSEGNIKTMDEDNFINKPAYEPKPEDNKSDAQNQISAQDVQREPVKSDNEETGIESTKNHGLPSSFPDENLINQKRNKKTCASCGSKNLKTAKFCVVCGEKFIDTPIEKSIEEPDLKTNDDKENPKSGEIGDPIEKIKRAKELLDIGAITQEEFESIKSKYLNMV